jgi:sensor histidine kinase YesM
VHPVLADRRWLVLHLVAWLVAGEAVAVLARTVLGTSWVGAGAFGVPLGVLGGLMSLSAWYVSRTTPARWTDRIRPLATWLLAAILCGGVWAALGQLWWQLLDRSGLVDLGIRREGLSALLLGVGVLGYLLAVTAYQVVQAFETTTAATRRALQSEVAQRDAELRALRAQIDPHFLFNSLNSIAGLIGADPAKAREMCQLLADFLRDSLRVGGAGRIPLSREVALAEQYLRVEQVRFGARLRVELALAPDTDAVAVPALLLQPLVENAVRHGIATCLEGGAIVIAARRAAGHVVISVINPRDPEASRRGTGLGIDIVRRRLAATFGDDASLSIEPGPESFRAQVTVPVEEG